MTATLDRPPASCESFEQPEHFRLQRVSYSCKVFTRFLQWHSTTAAPRAWHSSRVLQTRQLHTGWRAFFGLGALSFLARAHSSHPREVSHEHSASKATAMATESPALKYTRKDLASLVYHPVRPLDVISEEIGIAPQDIAKLDANENLHPVPAEMMSAVTEALLGPTVCTSACLESSSALSNRSSSSSAARASIEGCDTQRTSLLLT